MTDALFNVVTEHNDVIPHPWRSKPYRGCEKNLLTLHALPFYRVWNSIRFNVKIMKNSLITILLISIIILVVGLMGRVEEQGG